MRRTILPIVSALCLAGCAAAATPWKNDDLPKERWTQDWSACKRIAERRVIGYRDEGSGPLDNYDRIQAKRQIDAQVAACMVERGYVPTRPAPGN